MLLRKSFVFFYHFLFMALYFLIVLWSTTVKVHESSDPYVRQAQWFFYSYFTLWNMAIQMFYLGQSLSKDYQWFLSNPKRIEKNGEFLASTVFPSTVFACVGFWLAIIINREWIITPAMEGLVPESFLYATHSLSFIPLFLDYIFDDIEFPSKETTRRGLWKLILYYGLTYYGTYFVFGRWTYNVFNLIDWPSRIIVTIVCIAIFVIGFEIGVQLQSLNRIKYSAFKRLFKSYQKMLKVC